MKNLKKITAAVLCLVLTFVIAMSLSTIAFAEEPVTAAPEGTGLSFNLLKDFIQIIKAAVTFIKAGLPGIKDIFIPR